MSQSGSSSFSWCNQEPQYQQEHASTTNLFPAQPAVSFHIMLGRGRGAYQSEGNRRLRQMIGWFLPEYMAATTSKEKLGITSRIVAFVKEKGGQFGTHDLAGKFIEAPDRQARVKVAQLIRGKRRAMEEESSRPGPSQQNFTSLVHRDHQPTATQEGDIQLLASSASSIMDDHAESDQVLDAAAAACLDSPQHWHEDSAASLLCEPNGESQSGGQEETRTRMMPFVQQNFAYWLKEEAPAELEERPETHAAVGDLLGRGEAIACKHEDEEVTSPWMGDYDQDSHPFLRVFSSASTRKSNLLPKASSPYSGRGSSLLDPPESPPVCPGNIAENDQDPHSFL